VRQDEQGRWVSDDGQWVWDGNSWQPRGAAGGAPIPSAGAGSDPAATQIHSAGVAGPAGGQGAPAGYGYGGGAGSGYGGAASPDQGATQGSSAGGAAVGDSSETVIMPGLSGAGYGQAAAGGPAGPSSGGAPTAGTQGGQFGARHETRQPSVEETAAWKPDFGDGEESPRGEPEQPSRGAPTAPPPGARRRGSSRAAPPRCGSPTNRRCR